jgi:molybdenum cofactor cytidylyltransferase
VIFGPTPVDDAEGAILAHSVRSAAGAIHKGTRLTATHIAALRLAGQEEVVVALLDAGDVHEDEAAHRIAVAAAGPGLDVGAAFTGRCNLYAAHAGLVVVDRAAVDRLNGVDPGITLATLGEYEPAVAGEMVATVKIIPFAVAGDRLAAALASAGSLRIAPYVRRRIGLVATELPTLRPAVMDRTRQRLDARLQVAGAAVIHEARVAHDAAAIAAALADLARRGAELMVVFGAAATVDAADVVPAAIEQAGGRVVRVGMPVDPGNLLVLGDLAGVPVVGAPGCARSPKENGFDWVLRRLLAGIAVTSEDVARLGVGGLLAEIAARPQLRQGGARRASRPPRIAAVILAAGQSRRMQGANKLVATIGGRPLVRTVGEAALASRARPVVVVTGHRPEDVRAALAGLAVAYVNNPDYAEGLATSLRSGIAGLPPEIDGVVILLGDMPGVDSTLIDRLIAAFDPTQGAEIVVPTHDGKRGNPVLWSARFFDELRAVKGDVGGKHLLGEHTDAVVALELGAAVAWDIDTPEDLTAAGGGRRSHRHGQM